jgi:hypothetical protein
LEEIEPWPKAGDNDGANARIIPAHNLAWFKVMGWCFRKSPPNRREQQNDSFSQYKSGEMNAR